jgi:hypothetical protein
VRKTRLASVLLLGLMTVDAGHAADVPPADILNSIIAKLTPPSRRVDIEFVQGASQPNNICRLQPYDMRFVARDRMVGSYSVLLDPQSGTNVVPHEFFAVLTRITVDTDGSPHTYHPEDPEGTGSCQRTRDGSGHETLQGICAIEKFANGDAHVFRDDTDLAGSELVGEWRDMWPLVRDRKLKSVDMGTVGGQKNRYLFYWDARRLTTVFNDDVIPRDHQGYPCMQDKGSAYADYFVAATSLRQIAPTREDGCAPQRYLDAETVPYFVLPKGGFGEVRVGDIVIAQILQNGVTRTVYGLVGDAGGARLGEASVAFNAGLLGKSTTSIASMRDTWALDIDGPKVAILVLGGTREKLNGWYHPSNVNSVARGEFARWGGGDPMKRMEACFAAAPANSRR